MKYIFYAVKYICESTKIEKHFRVYLYCRRWVNLKKIVWIVLLSLILGLVGCDSKENKNVTTEQGKPKIDEKAKDKEEIDKSIMQLAKLVDEKSYEQAKVILVQLSTKTLDETQKSNVDRLKSKVDSELSKISKENMKNEFKKKLDNIELGMSDLNAKESS